MKRKKKLMKVDIPSQIIGELFYNDPFGNRCVPKKIYFTNDERLDLSEGGKAFTVFYSAIYGNTCHPVFKGDGERVVIPGYAGLTCEYNEKTGSIENFTL